MPAIQSAVDTQTVLINGRAYDWASLKLRLLGQLVLGVTAVSYEETQEKVNNYGAGTLPVSRGLGKIEPKASLTLEMKELERIMASAKAQGLQRLQDIPPFPVVVAYLNEANVVVTHTLNNCEFTNNKREVKSGDTQIEVELELILSHITW